MGAADILNRYPGANSLFEEASSEAVGGNRVHDRDAHASQTDPVKEREYRGKMLAVDTTIVVLAAVACVAAFALFFLMFYG
jgi:hypothetical protein